MVYTFSQLQLCISFQRQFSTQSSLLSKLQQRAFLNIYFVLYYKFKIHSFHIKSTHIHGTTIPILRQIIVQREMYCFIPNAHPKTRRSLRPWLCRLKGLQQYIRSTAGNKDMWVVEIRQGQERHANRTPPHMTCETLRGNGNERLLERKPTAAQKI